MRTDVLYEMTDGYIRKDPTDVQHTWLTEYRLDAMQMGRMCEKYPALKLAWEQFKTIHNMCKAEDEINRNIP